MTILKHREKRLLATIADLKDRLCVQADRPAVNSIGVQTDSDHESSASHFEGERVIGEANLLDLVGDEVDTGGHLKGGRHRDFLYLH